MVCEVLKADWPKKGNRQRRAVGVKMIILMEVTVMMIGSLVGVYAEFLNLNC